MDLRICTSFFRVSGAHPRARHRNYRTAHRVDRSSQRDPRNAVRPTARSSAQAEARQQLQRTSSRVFKPPAYASKSNEISCAGHTIYARMVAGGIYT